MQNNQELVKKVADYVSNKKPGDIIYAGKISKEFGVNLEDVYHILVSMEDEGILTMLLEAYCNSCQSLSGAFYASFWDAPNQLVCPHCHKTIDNVGADSIVVFKKI